jgi:hypothetical protein
VSVDASGKAATDDMAGAGAGVGTGTDAGAGVPGGPADQEMAPAIAVCANCGSPVSEGTCRVFHEVPTCPDCFHDLDLMRLAVAPPPEEDAVLTRVLTEGIGPASPSQLRRIAGLDKFAGLLPQPLGGELLASAATATAMLDAAALVRAVIAARAVARRGTGPVKADGGTVNILVHLAGLVTYEVALTAMVRAGVARRSTLDDAGEWGYEYTEELAPGADPRSSFPAYARDMRASGDALLGDLEGVEGVNAEHVEALRKRLEELLRA